MTKWCYKTMLTLGLLLSIAFLLASCGGGGGGNGAVNQYQYKMMLEISPTPNPGFNAVISLPSGGDAKADVAAQAATSDFVALQLPGAAKSIDLPTVQAYATEGAKHSNVRWVYIYDELFWSGSGFQFGTDGAAVSQASAIVRQAGLKSALTIMPAVILDPRFSFDLNSVDVIAIDLYPGTPPMPTPVGDCAYKSNSNPNSTILYCSVQRLRSMGYTGQVWYVYQGFGVVADPDNAKTLRMQAQTIADAPSMGVTGLVSFGYKPYPDVTTPTWLYPGEGTPLDSLVNCRDC